LLFLVGTLAALSGVVWWQLPALLNWGVTQSLQQYGLTNVTLQINEVGVSRVSIDRFDVTYPDADTTLRIELEQVTLDYTLSQLFAANVDSLSIDSVAITLDKKASEQVSTTSTLPTLEQLLAAYNAVDTRKLPINMVQLPSISISHNLASDSAGTFDTIEFRAELSKQAAQLNAEVWFANKQKIEWLSDRDMGWNLQFFNTPVQAQLSRQESFEEPQPVFNGSLNQIDQSLVFSADIKRELLQRWLPSTLQAENAVELSDVAFRTIIKSNSPKPGLAVLTTITAPSLGYQDWNLQSINSQFDIYISQASATFDPSHTSLKVNAKSSNTVSFEHARFADWQADNLTLSLSSDVSLTENVSKLNSSELSLAFSQLRQAGELELSDVSFVGAVSALIENEKWQLKVDDAWQLSSQYSRLDETELPQGWRISSTTPLRFDGDFREVPKASLEKTVLEIAVPVAQDKALEQRVYPHNASLKLEQARFNQGKLVATGLLAIPHLTIDDTATDVKQESGWRLDNVTQYFELNDDLLTSRGSVQSIERDLHIDTTSEHDFKQRQGGSTFHFKAIEFSDPQRLKQLMSPTAPPLNLVTGEVDLSGQARWRDKADQWQLTLGIDAQLKNLGGAYEDVYFSGGNGHMSLQVYPEIRSKQTQRLTVAQLDAGIENKDMVVEFMLRPSRFGDLPLLDIQKAQTQLLKGKVSLKPTQYDLNRSQQAVQVVLENIDLNELVTLQKLDDVQATGLVNGLLPIVISNGEISIDDGQLKALAPGGVLQYQADAGALESNQYAETVVLALRDFHYDVLRADTQYKPDGTLLLELQLQGNNPSFEQGRQINLNVNLEQNVLKLLESLRLYDGISDKLDKRVRDFYQQTK